MSLSEDLTALEIAAGVQEGRFSAGDVVRAAFARMDGDGQRLNCFTSAFFDRALLAASRVDETVRSGRDPGPLAGAPFAVKNLFDVKGEVTLAGSRIDAQNPPARRSAAAVERLEAAGAILVGALNMDEYAYGFTTENRHYGATRNPHDPRCIAGGSSGGSAAAAAAGLVAISLGSDTNGSIRVPAALCGVYGLKPTFGRLSRRGARPFVHSLDHIGPFARTVRDLAKTYDILQGQDELDPVCTERPVEPVSDGPRAAPPRIRVGVLGGYFRAGASLQALAATEEIADRLAARPVELEGVRAARAAAFCLTGAEGGSLHWDNLRQRADDFDPAVRYRLIAGALQPAMILAKAQRIRRAFLASALRLFQEVDVLLAPATPFCASPVGSAAVEVDGQPIHVRASLGLYTQPFSFIGLPAVTVPVIRAGALPVGVQLVAAPWREDLLFDLAMALEESGAVGARPPSQLGAHRDDDNQRS